MEPNPNTTTVTEWGAWEEAKKERKRAQHRLRREEDARLIALFKEDLEKEYGTVGHPKADRLFEMAWSHGDSLHLDVAYHYDDLSELVK